MGIEALVGSLFAGLGDAGAAAAATVPADVAAGGAAAATLPADVAAASVPIDASIVADTAAAAPALTAASADAAAAGAAGLGAAGDVLSGLGGAAAGLGGLAGSGFGAVAPDLTALAPATAQTGVSAIPLSAPGAGAAGAGAAAGSAAGASAPLSVLPAGAGAGDFGATIPGDFQALDTGATQALGAGSDIAINPSTASGTLELTGGAGAGTGASSGLGNLFGNLSTKELLGYGGLALGGGGLLYDVLRGNQPPEFQGQLQSQANQLLSQGGQLQGYLSSGQLPPGIQAGLNSARDAAVATIKSKYAALGQSGSSSEAQAIANVQQEAVTNGANIAMQLYNTGVSESEFASQIYNDLMQASIAQDTALSGSIANFAGALAGAGLKTAAG